MLILKFACKWLSIDLYFPHVSTLELLRVSTVTSTTSWQCWKSAIFYLKVNLALWATNLRKREQGQFCCSGVVMCSLPLPPDQVLGPTIMQPASGGHQWGTVVLVVVSVLDFRFEIPWFNAHSLTSCCFLRQETFPTLCLSTQVYKMGTSDILLGVTLWWTSIPSFLGGSGNTLSCFMLQKPG